MTEIEQKALALRAENSALQAENDRLNALIDAAAQHWMDLQFKHPIQWEGAIDGAMKAACDTILRALRERDEAVKALRGLIDDEPCRYDHHGYCQTHFVTDPCEMAIARKALASIEGTGQ